MKCVASAAATHKLSSHSSFVCRHEKGDCEFDSVPASENMCSYAHSTDELKEWQIRKQYVINRVQKARDDRLIAPAQAMDDLLSSKHKA